MNINKLLSMDVDTQNYPAHSKDITIYLLKDGALINVGEFAEINWTETDIYEEDSHAGSPIPTRVYVRTEVKGTLMRGHYSPELITAKSENVPIECQKPGKFEIMVTICFPDKTSGKETTYAFKDVSWDDYQFNSASNAIITETLNFTTYRKVEVTNNPLLA